MVFVFFGVSGSQRGASQSLSSIICALNGCFHILLDRTESDGV